MINLKKLQLKSFLSHADTIINFEENTKLLLDGSSGSGKSSILDGILFAIYGQGRAGNRELISKHDDTARVSLVLSNVSSGDHVRITRTISINGKHTLEVEESDSEEGWDERAGTKTEKQQWIEEFIGCSYLLFVNSVAYVQGNSDSFINQSPARRKELLLEIVKAGDHDKAYEKAKTALSSTQEEQRLLEAQVESKWGIIHALEDEIDRELVLKEELFHAEGMIETVEQRKKTCSESIEALKLLKNKSDSLLPLIGATAGELRAKTERMEDLKVQMEKMEKWKTLIKNDGLGEKKNKLVREREDLKERIAVIDEMERVKPGFGESDLDEADRIQVRIGHHLTKEVCPSGEKCPYYGDTISAVETLKKEKQECLDRADIKIREMGVWEKERKSLGDRKEKAEELRQIDDNLIEVKAKIREYEQIDSDLMRMAFVPGDYAAAVIECEELSVKLKEMEKDLKKTKELFSEKDLLQYQDDLTGLVLQERQYRESKTRIEETLSLIAVAKGRLEEIMKEQNLLMMESGELILKEERLKLIKEAFGSKGIKAIAIDYLLPRLEDKVNEVLTQLSGLRIHLDSQRPSVDGEGVVEGLYIVCTNESNESLPIENLSGGERTKVMVAFSEALASLQKCGFRLIDEAITALDPDSLEHFLETLTYLQKKYPQVLAISHIPEVKEMFDTSITCVKREGITHLEK